MTSMRAARIDSPRHNSVADVPVPIPGPGEVRVRLEGCGVCASNLGPWEGHPWIEYPLAPGAPGHEGWGHVDACGSGVSSVREGDRVAFLSAQAYAEYDLTSAERLVPLPGRLAGQPFPGEALGCAINVFQRSAISEGDSVAIVGIGFLGALLTRLASHAGARVLAVSRRRFALSLARQYGAAETATFEEARQAIAGWTGGRGCERVIEAAGRQSALDLASELTAERGRLVIAGYHQDGPRQVDMQLWNWKGIDVVNAHERDPRAYLRGIRFAIRAVSDGWLDPRPLYTHTFGLEGLGAALEAADRRPDGFVKALLLP